MSPPEIEPLDLESWFRRVERLHEKTAYTDGEAPDASIRLAYHLVKLAPGVLRDMLPMDIDEEALEGMLDCGGYESAVMALIGKNVAFKAERALDQDRITVTMSIDPHAINGRGENEMCSKAMLQAWAHCFVNYGKMARALNRDDPVPRKSRSGSRPKSTEH